MSRVGQILVVSLERSLDPLIEEVVEAEGYSVSRATSSAEVLLDEEGGESLALMVNADAMADVDMLLRTATERMPGARCLLALPNGTMPDPTEMTGWPAAEQLLCVTSQEDPADTKDRIRGFLRGDGYRWASDMAVTVSSDMPLLDSAERFAGYGDELSEKMLAFVRDLARYSDVDEMLREALVRYLDALRCDAGSIYFWDERSETLVLKAAQGPDADLRIGLRQQIGEGFAGWVAKARDSILVTDARKVRQLSQRQCRRYSNFSCLGTPILYGDRLFGVVCLTMTKADRVFRAEDLLLAQALTRKLGSLMRPLSLLVELRSFNERLSQVMEGASDWLLEKNTQMEAMRALSSDIMDGIPLAVIAYDRRLRVCFANVAAQVMLGEQELVADGPARPPLVNGLSMDERAWREKLRGVLQTAEDFRLQRVAYRSEGQDRVVDIHCSPLEDAAGSTIAGILTVQDVTEDVQMEEKLSSAERLALVGKIAAKVAHELNNPLDGILRFIGLAERLMDEQPEKARHYLDESRKGLLRMSSILTELLAFSRTYRRGGRPVSLSQIIRDALTLYATKTEETNVDIVLDLPPDLPRCPDTELCQVINNVVKNALDAMGEDGKLTLRAVEKNGQVAITVADTGPGVPEEIRDKIFEPFFTTKEDGTGTGLGLAACVDSLHRIGGDIRLLPSDEGAVFEIVVPVEAE